MCALSRASSGSGDVQQREEVRHIRNFCIKSRYRHIFVKCGKLDQTECPLSWSSVCGSGVLQ